MSLSIRTEEEEWDYLCETGEWIHLSHEVLSEKWIEGKKIPHVRLSKVDRMNASRFLDNGYTVNVDVPSVDVYSVNKELYYHLLSKEPIVKSISDNDILTSIWNHSRFDRYQYRVYGLLLELPVCLDTELTECDFDNDDSTILRASLWWGFEHFHGLPETTRPLLLDTIRKEQNFVSIVDAFIPEGFIPLLKYLTDDECNIMWLQSVLTPGLQDKVNEIKAPMLQMLEPFIHIILEDAARYVEDFDGHFVEAVASFYAQKLLTNQQYVEINIHL